MNNRFSRALMALAVSSAVVIGGSVVAPTWAAPSYPSAADVAAAKRNVAAKKAMIARIEKIVQQLSVQADALGKVAEIKGEAFNQAQNAVDVMTAKVNSLQSQANAANAAANKAKTQLGQIAAQMFRDGSGGTSLNLFLNSGKASDLLYQLGAQEKVAQQSNTIYNRSLATEKFAQSLSDQLASAKAELATKAAAAKTLFTAAQQAANAVQAQVDANNKLNKTFYAQLAVLQNTSAEIEKEREEGLAAEARQNAGTTKPIAPELYTVGDPDPAKVQVAIDFAKSNLGDAYVLGGMGPSVWDCSGITKASYAAAGIYIGTHSATNQFETLAAARKLVPLTEWQAGDLIWYTQSSDFNGDKYHVAIYLGGNMMLEAPNPARTVRIVPVRYGELFPYAGRPSA
jgi:cell wall-associated NlpC family hydrolase